MNQQVSMLDALTQHQAYLQRASTQAVNEVLKPFNGNSNRMLSELRDLLDELSESEKSALAGGQYTTPALREIRDLIGDWFTALNAALPEVFAASAVALAVYEAQYIYKLMDETAPELDGEKLLKSAKKLPFAGGNLLDQMFSKISNDVRARVEYTIRDGIAQGQTNQQIIQRIKGRKAVDYQDGILNQSRQSIDAIVRTARNHISNTSYSEMWKALGFEYVKFVATLDGRTSKTCASLDSSVYPADGSYPRPPLHPRCRSSIVGCNADGETIGKRPFVADDRPVKDIPKDERTGKIGQVDSNTSYAKWFSNQSADFQKEWLGPKRYELYKQGKYSIDKFVDPQGKPYTLAELEALDQKTFKELGL